jgi:hypothetical protein
MMNHAVRKNMGRAVLITGDRDFRPLVESLVQMGIFVVVAGDKAHGSRELLRAADSSIAFGFEDYFNLSTQSLQSDYPLPGSSRIKPNDGLFEGPPVARGQLADAKIVITSLQDMYRAYVPSKSGQAHIFDHQDAGRLKLYLKLRFGDVNWTA